MPKSLYMKLVLILLLLITSLMAVTGVFLNGAVSQFFIDEFNETMAEAFERNTEFAQGIQEAAETGSSQVWGILSAYRDILGAGLGRNIYLLDRRTGEVLYSQTGAEGFIEQSPNILSAMAGRVGSDQRMGAAFFDCAVPIGGDDGYIVYIHDNKERLEAQNRSLFFVILQALVLGLTFSIILSLLLSKAITTPIEDLTKGAARIASGDFLETIPIHSRDEIGALTHAFNHMASTLQKSLAEKEKHEDIRREFVSNVSHELRTPLTGIKSYAETLAEPEELTFEEIKRFSSVIVDEADRMTRLVRDLLTLSSFDHAKADWRIEEFDLTELLNRIYDLLRMEAKSFLHKLSLSIGKLPKKISGDRDRLEQVLINIITNAIRYTPKGGTISIEADSDEEFVKISVADDGIGIPEEDLSNIFTRFYRVDKARSRSMGGTGLGLAIAKEIMENHGGTISIQSKLRSEDKEDSGGTTVILQIPRRAHEKPPKNAPANIS